MFHKCNVRGCASSTKSFVIMFAYKKPTPALAVSKVQVPEISERREWNCLQHLKKTATGPDLILLWVWRGQGEDFTPLICKDLEHVPEV